MNGNRETGTGRRAGKEGPYPIRSAATKCSDTGCFHVTIKIGLKSHVRKGLHADKLVGNEVSRATPPGKLSRPFR